MVKKTLKNMMKDSSADFEVLSGEDQRYVIEFVKDLLMERAHVL